MNMVSRSEPIDPASSGSHVKEPACRRASFRIFIRALAEEIDSASGAQRRDELLRGVGARMAELLALPSVSSLEALELEMNDRLSDQGWGSVELELREDDRFLAIAHSGLPKIGSAGNPLGAWLAAALEGLYQTWIIRQPGGDAGLRVRREPNSGNELLIMRCSRN